MKRALPAIAHYLAAVRKVLEFLVDLGPGCSVRAPMGGGEKGRGNIQDWHGNLLG